MGVGRVDLEIKETVRLNSSISRLVLKQESLKNWPNRPKSYPYLTSAFHEPSVIERERERERERGGGTRASHQNFVVIAPMIVKFGIGIKLDVFYTMVSKKFVTSLLLT